MDEQRTRCRNVVDPSCRVQVHFLRILSDRMEVNLADPTKTIESVKYKKVACCRSRVTRLVESSPDGRLFTLE
jgi:hypothetical protein